MRMNAGILTEREQLSNSEAADWFELRRHMKQDPSLMTGINRLEAILEAFRVKKDSNKYSCNRVPSSQFAGMDLIAEIGSGGQGRVWLAYEPYLDRYVALKLRKRCSGDLSSALLDEARKLARLDHPNVVRVLGAKIEEGNVGIWMEHVDGLSLSQVVSRRGPIPVAEVLALAKSICSALSAIHRTGFVHADVKPANIMYGVDGRAVLIDLGSAQNFCQKSSSVVTGTRAYIAPEILVGDAPSPSSDLYSLGMTMLYLLCAKMPHSSEDAAVAARRVANDDVELSAADLPQCVPASLFQLIRRSVSRNPLYRPVTAEAMFQELEDIECATSGRGKSVMAKIRRLGVRGLNKIIDYNNAR